ncbi:MAG: Gfo/Idh/MocA family protein [Bacteroidia bacterium]
MKVAIVGLGSIASKHIFALKEINPLVEIYALRSGLNSNVVEGVKNIKSLEEVEDLDFVLISNPTSLHLEAIKMVTKQNLPMVIEKPAFYKLEGYEEVIDEINAKDIFTYVACNLRFHPCLQYLKDYIANENAVINEVNVYCGSYLPDWRPNRDYKQIYSANLDMGGGVHLDLFHELDYICWIFGLPREYKGYTSNHSSLDISAPDYANYLLSYDNFNVGVVLNYYRRQPKREIEILFEDETWIVDLITNIITTDNGKVIFKPSSFSLIDTYVKQMSYVIGKLNLSERPMNDINETIEILKISLSHESIN